MTEDWFREMFMSRAKTPEDKEWVEYALEICEALHDGRTSSLLHKRTTMEEAFEHFRNESNVRRSCIDTVQTARGKEALR